MYSLSFTDFFKQYRIKNWPDFDSYFCDKIWVSNVCYHNFTGAACVGISSSMKAAGVVESVHSILLLSHVFSIAHHWRTSEHTYTITIVLYSREDLGESQYQLG